MSAHSRCQIVRVDFSFLKSSQRHAPLAANTARNRQHGAPTRRGGAVDWLHPWWREEPLKLKNPCTIGCGGWKRRRRAHARRRRCGMEHTHGGSRASFRQRLPLCCDTSLCSHAIFVRAASQGWLPICVERPSMANSFSVERSHMTSSRFVEQSLRAGSIFAERPRMAGSSLLLLSGHVWRAPAFCC